MVRFSVYVVWPSALSLNYLMVLKIHKTKAVKNICRQISLLISLTTVWRVCVNFWVIFGHFGKEIFFLKG